MKSVIESSVYLVILSFICIISLDFIAINRKIGKGNELQQYIKDVILINGESKNNNIDTNTYNKVNEIAKEHKAKVSVQYYDSVNDSDYYKVKVDYPITSGVFKVNKNCSYSSIVKVSKV